MGYGLSRKQRDLTYQHLEPRRVLAAAVPSAHDQYVLEMINAGRANPTAYAASLGIDLNEGLPAGTISAAAKPPLAFHPSLVYAAQQHSDWMLATDTFSHTGSGGTTPGQRMSNAGYSFTGNWSWGENIGYTATTGQVDLTEFSKRILENLFVDRNIAGRGHRLALMNDKFMEIGIGTRTGDYRGYNAVMMTQDFARSTGPFLTGVAYADTVLANRFYTPGEGLGGIVITAIRDGGNQLYRTQTTAAGGYSLQLPKGRYSIMASGAGLGDSQFLSDVLIGTTNRKLDFLKGVQRQAPEVAVFGNGRSIANKDNSPSALDHTLFGTALVAGETITRTFSIKNHGNSTLYLNGSTRVFTSTPEFVVSALPPQEVLPGQTVTFELTFDPALTGTRTAVVQFASNDRMENPFTFTVSGVGAEGLPPQGMPPFFQFPGPKSGDPPRSSAMQRSFNSAPATVQPPSQSLAEPVSGTEDALDQFFARWADRRVQGEHSEADPSFLLTDLKLV